jgi:glycosyltransferase involved in cell wall biosynthesis
VTRAPVVHLFDSGLRAREGHHDHFAYGLRDRLRREGLELHIHAHQSLEPGLTAELGARPVFQRSLYDRRTYGAFAEALRDHDQAARTYGADLERADVDLGPDDLCLLPTATPAELQGLASWLSSSNRQARLATIFHWADARRLGSDYVQGALLRRAASAVSAIAPDRLWIAATHQGLVEPLGEIFGQAARLTPSLTFHTSTLSPPKPAHGALRVGILGAPRAAKGLARVIHLLDALPQGAFDITLQAHGLSAEALGPLEAAAQGKARLVTHWLTSQDLDALFAELDCVLLPYEPAVYATMVSGVFTLAAGQGRPVIAPAGTWMSQRLVQQEVAGVVYDGNETDALIKALFALSTDRQRYQSMALAWAPSWRARYGADALLDDLLSTIGHRSSSLQEVA